jgi:LacI family transcriptional regulator
MNCKDVLGTNTTDYGAFQIVPKLRRVVLMLELEWPFKRHLGVFAGIQQYAQQQGWESTIDEVVYDKLPLRRSSRLPYDGVIARATKPLAERANRIGLPVVNIWFSSPVRDVLPGVFSDYVAAGRLRAEHLLARGFQNFSAITSLRNQAHEAEMKEFRRVVGEAGYACTSSKVPLRSLEPRYWRTTELAIASWIADLQPPIGLYVGQDMIGRLVTQLCSERGWRVPQDVAIITGENDETVCEHPRPSLSSVEMGYERVGYEAARLLGRLMDDREKGTKQKKGEAPEHILMPPKGLVVRESTDFYAVDDELVARALAFIAANSHLKIGQSQVSHAVAKEPKTLQRRFHKVLDRTITEEIRRVRIERAKRELTQTDRSLDEISRKAGFGPRKRMYEVFCRDVGLAPSEYRKQRQMEDGS